MKGDVMIRIFKKIALYFKTLWRVIVMHLKGYRFRRGPGLSREERRRILRQRGGVTPIQFRRMIHEHRFATRSECQRLAKVKIASPEPKGLRNRKKARRRFKIWYNRIVEAQGVSS